MLVFFACHFFLFALKNLLFIYYKLLSGCFIFAVKVKMIPRIWKLLVYYLNCFHCFALKRKQTYLQICGDISWTDNCREPVQYKPCSFRIADNLQGMINLAWTSDVTFKNVIS